MKIKRVVALFMMIAVILTMSSTSVFAASETKITVRQALDVVLEFMPYVEVESFQNGGATYQFIVTDHGERYVILVNAVSGEIDSYTKENVSVQQPTTPQVTTPQVTTPTNQQTVDNTATAYARTIALERVGGGTVVRVETKYPPHGGVEYKVLIVYGDYKYDVDVDSNGNVKKYKMDLITKTGPKAYNTTAFISAKAIAIEKAGGGIVYECNLDYKPHASALIYHIHVGNGQYEYCVEIDGTSGSVLKFETRYKP